MGDDEVISVVIVDDHALLREGTRQILERAGGFEIVGEADDGDKVEELVAETAPDVLLLDVRLPGANGVEVARRVAQASPGTKVLMLSAFDEVDYVQACLAVGVAGYLLKTTPSDELVGAIRAAYAGVVVLGPGLSSNLVRQPVGTRGGSGVEALTSREREVVRLVALGLSNKAIALELGISPRTVEGHLNHVFDKVGASSRSALVRLAMVNGLIES
ncbi:MAG: response regulator transcription factor [Actinomycetota bacterium]|jgi:DNA-binding NarL/FixJ family response regulator|nr:response regulator transcription factor [Actinomycetota bacterium]